MCCCACRSKSRPFPRVADRQLSRPLHACDVDHPADARRQGLRSEWGVRQRGRGPYAWMIGRRFEMAAKRLGLNIERRKLRTDLFTPPVPVGGQLKLALV